ncbi:lanthionine synthetase LanC family protein [Phaeobacter sp. CECT 5382]|uniref:lanthionine synthetase LanC family protein n=1 Tax=Phaeobacter sp. CECT 5382 TaxID=1712645 RepID=UPI0012E3554C
MPHPICATKPRCGLSFALRQRGEVDFSWKTGRIGHCIAVQEALPILDRQDVAFHNWLEEQMAALSSHSGLALDDLCFGEAARASVLKRSTKASNGRDWPRGAHRAFARLRASADKGDLAFGWPQGVALPGFFQGTAGIGYQLLRNDFDLTLPDIFTFC